jgi:hypothetical protein
MRCRDRLSDPTVQGGEGKSENIPRSRNSKSKRTLRVAELGFAGPGRHGLDLPGLRLPTF